MEQIAAPGTIRLTAATAAEAGPAIVTRAHGAMRVRGLPEPVEVFELLEPAGPSR
jgi:class 3 adenylate cyclase